LITTLFTNTANHIDTCTNRVRIKMEGREAGRSSQLESTTAPPSQREKKQQLDQVQPATTQTHETPDPTLAIGNSPRFLGDRQPLPDELQLLEDFQLLLDEGQVALPRRYVRVRTFCVNPCCDLAYF